MPDGLFRAVFSRMLPRDVIADARRARGDASREVTARVIQVATHGRQT